MRTGTNQLTEALKKIGQEAALNQSDSKHLISQSIASTAHDLSKIDYLPFLEAKNKGEPIPAKKLKELSQLFKESIGCREYFDYHNRYLKLILE